MTFGVTRQQSRLLAALRAVGDGPTPSYDELAAAIGVKSKSTVCDMIAQLEVRGHVRRIPGAVRTIEIAEDLSLDAASTALVLRHAALRGVRPRQVMIEMVADYASRHPLPDAPNTDKTTR